MSERGERAEALFKSGYNCAQAVVMAFEDMIPITEEECAKLASPFGGGMGRMREVCGAFSGMLMVLGFVDGSADATGRNEIYARTQELARRYREMNGSIVCGELLGTKPAPEGVKLKKRPCSAIVRSAADMLEASLREE